MILTLGYTLVVLIVVSLVDLGSRAIPFPILESPHESRFVWTIGVWMPAEIPPVPAIISVQSSLISAPGKTWTTIAVSTITMAVHLLGGRRVVVSIAVGILSYVLFISL